MSIENGLHRIALNGATMGTRYSTVFYATAADGHETMAKALHEGVTEIDDVMSNWKMDSVLSHVNRLAPGKWFDIPDCLMAVLEAAIAIEIKSAGAFDIGVAGDVAAWGFGPQAQQQHAQRDSLCARAATASNLEIDSTNRRIRKHAPLMLDLSGIAKGYGVDRLGEILSHAGIENWLAGIDGEMRGKGMKPDGTAWAIGHERPVPGRREVMGVIELTDLAVATSGTYRHFRAQDGEIFSHTIDPETARPVRNKLASVTVFAPDCMTADAWATAVLVDGHWPPKRFVPPANIDAMIHRADEIPHPIA